MHSIEFFVVYLNCNPLDEMGSRIDELEQSINDLKTEMGADATPVKAKPDETKSESGE